FLAALASAVSVLLAASPAGAQEVTSREVVQPLPSADVQRLNRALMELAKRPKSLDALVEAGDAALALEDLDAAMGFYGRADDIDSANVRVKLGIAAVYLRSGRPVEALEAYDLAERAGATPPEYARDRGLAYDLVGDHDRARAAYEQALAVNPEDAETIRRLALSQAIAGNQAGFEDILRPLLDRRDYASFRTRAFGLAILGEQARAAAIVDAVMPRDLAARLVPYLAYMPRLTASQQAAAANLGIFPRVAEIGREDPRIARFAREAEADRRLEPAGAPLGAPSGGGEGSAREESAREVPDVPGPTAADAAVTLAESAPVAPAAPESAAADARPGFDLAATAGPVDPPAPDAPGPSDTANGTPRVADAFADLDSADPPIAEPAGEAVDLAAIEVPRERPAPPEPPAFPRRVWVQVATGRDLSALAFDWRRIARAADGLLDDYSPHTTPWGQANRLLAGPLDNADAARDLVNALAAKGLDTFPYTSPEGRQIDTLE
ncbi:MAG: tetratricopeptide repeat protein, partial [Erythrobacter sp.]